MSDIRTIKGIGEKTAALFEKLGISTTEDLIHTLPREYVSYEAPVPISSLKSRETRTIAARILRSPVIVGRGKNTVLTVLLGDESGQLTAKWFHMPYLKGKLIPGARYLFRGILLKKGNTLSLLQPEIFTPAQYDERQGKLFPVYPLTTGLSNLTVRKAVQAALMNELSLEEYLPRKILEEEKLLPERKALQAVHFPASKEELLQGRRRLVFDEFFLFSLAVHRQKKDRLSSYNAFPVHSFQETDQILASLPYDLTSDQKKTWEDMRGDLSGAGTMNRLIQGDVGSGKTILAFLAMLSMTETGAQAALMAPTEVLARQHYESLLQILSAAGLKKNVCLLTGSVSAREKKQIYRQIEAGEADLVIGTHAVIQDKVHFHRLGLVVTDEQHRFGVRQRERLAGQGAEAGDGKKNTSSGDSPRPHILVMSATPIPRTLALILYADLDVSIIRSLPVGRLPIKNCVIREELRENALRFIEKEAARGHQAYVICPLVEESEVSDLENASDTCAALKKRWGDRIPVALLHGRMKPEEKNQIMQDFADRKISVLVSTTVIEVGINVPNATVMMIENADHFGLAQLHQIRGRVGRGQAQSYCIFMDSSDSGEPDRRLDIIGHTNDGFQIAEEDLKMRGPGELLGVRQSGEAGFAVGDIYADSDVLKEAAQAAARLNALDPGLTEEDHPALLARLEKKLPEIERHINL